MIYVGDCETNGLLDVVTKFHCICFSPIDKDIFYVFCDHLSLPKEHKEYFESKGIQFFDTNDYLKLLNSKKTKGIIIHNIFGYDLPVFKKLSGIKYDYESINNRKLFICDSLVMSRNLNPERRPPKGTKSIHGLEAWGIRLGIKKPEIEDWDEQPLYTYINRVVEDVKINKATYFSLLKEMKNIAIDNGDKKGDWANAIKMAHKVYYLMCKQEDTGVKLDIPKAEELVIRINKEMKDIESKVEPSLGDRFLPKNQQLNPPKQPWKKAFDYKNPWTNKGALKKPVVDYLNLIGYTDPDNQKKYIRSMIKLTDIAGHIIHKNHVEELLKKHPSLLSISAINYCEKIGIEDEEEQFNEILRLDQKGEKPVLIKEKLRLKHKKDVKEFLIKDGWVPTMWKNRDILIDKKTKKKLSEADVEKKYQKWIEEFHNSVYWSFIIKDLGYKRDPDITTKTFKDKCIKNGRNLLSSPQFKDQRGTICSNLEKLTRDTSKLIVRWLSLQNRRNTISSPLSKTKKKCTGWLHHPRLKIDGRLPASHTGITPTYRKKHSIIVNVPKPKDHIVLGKEMRSLFISPDGYYNVGGDGVSIEAMCASHYTIPFDNGQYSKAVLGGEFHDNNAKYYSNAAGFEINRDDGKNISYALTYGASSNKIVKMMSVDKSLADKIVEAFWDANPGLKQVKEALEQYWGLTGNKYIFGLDGRKVFTRSKHSLMNTLFQHAGALILDYAQCYVYDKIVEHKLDIHRWGEFHDESQAYENENEIEIKYFNEKPEQEKDGKLWSKPKEDGDRWVQYYAPFGHLLDQGFIEASKFFNTNVKFRSEYLVGRSWKDCH